MKALSIRQPWAWLICKGYKDVDNRTWRLHMPPLLNYPAHTRRIFVHASKISDVERVGNICENELYILERLTENQREEYYNAILDFGAIIGEVDIVGCTDKSDSPWFTGPYGLLLANPVLYPRGIPYGGKLGFFEPDIKEVGCQ
jgi:hypothetical protein